MNSPALSRVPGSTAPLFILSPCSEREGIFTLPSPEPEREGRVGPSELGTNSLSPSPSLGGIEEQAGYGYDSLAPGLGYSGNAGCCSCRMLRVRLDAPRTPDRKATLAFAISLLPVGQPVPLGNRPLGGQPDDIEVADYVES